MLLEQRKAEEAKPLGTTSYSLWALQLPNKGNISQVLLISQAFLFSSLPQLHVGVCTKFISNVKIYLCQGHDSILLKSHWPWDLRPPCLHYHSQSKEIQVSWVWTYIGWQLHTEWLWRKPSNSLYRSHWSSAALTTRSFSVWFAWSKLLLRFSNHSYKQQTHYILFIFSRFIACSNHNCKHQ